MKKILALFFASTFSFNAWSSSCIAHRGFSSRYLENSIEAMHAALKIGAHGIEFDIRHTKDGVPIVVHDSKLEKVAVNKGRRFACPLDEKVKKLTFAEIRAKCLLKNGEEIPTLEELLIQTKKYNSYLFIELKDQPSAQFFNVINKHIKNFEKVRFISFKVSALNKVKDYYPRSKTLLLSRFMPRGLGQGGANLASRISIALYRWIGGHETGIWTVNTVKKITKAKRKRINFITTDYPDICLKV